MTALARPDLAFDGAPKKTCSRCERTYPGTLQYFKAQKGPKDGLNSQCRQCHRDYMNATNRRKKRGVSAQAATLTQRLIDWLWERGEDTQDIATLTAFGLMHIDLALRYRVADTRAGRFLVVRRGKVNLRLFKLESGMGAAVISPPACAGASQATHTPVSHVSA